MNKIFIKEELFQEVINSKKGSVNSEMELTLVSGTKYKLLLAIKFIEEIATNGKQNNDLSGKYISKEELIANNYELLDNEVVANDQLYRVSVGYIGVPIN